MRFEEYAPLPEASDDWNIYYVQRDGAARAAEDAGIRTIDTYFGYQLAL